MCTERRIRCLFVQWTSLGHLQPICRLDFVLPACCREPGSVVAPGATGKSQLALDVAASLALGRPVAGGLFPACQPGKVVFLAGEESDRLLAERIRGLLRLDEQGDPGLYDNLVLLPMAGESCTLLDGGPTDRTLRRTADRGSGGATRHHRPAAPHAWRRREQQYGHDPFRRCNGTACEGNRSSRGWAASRQSGVQAAKSIPEFMDSQCKT